MIKLIKDELSTIKLSQYLLPFTRFKLVAVL